MGNCISNADWFDAARQNGISSVNSLADQCASARELRNRPQRGIFKGFTALMYAAYYNHAQVIQRLFAQEKYVVIQRPTQIPMVSNCKIVSSFTIPTGFTALQVAVVSGAFDSVRQLFQMYSYTFFASRINGFEHPYDLLSLLIVSNSDEALRLFHEFFDLFKAIFLRQLDNGHLNLACFVGNTGFITMILQMANSEEYSQLVVRQLREFTCCTLHGVLKRLPSKLLASDEVVNFCRQRCLDYKLGKRETPVPRWMGQILPQANIRVSRFDPALDHSRASQYYDNSEHKERKMQVFRVRSCGDLLEKITLQHGAFSPLADSQTKYTVEKDSAHDLQNVCTVQELFVCEFGCRSASLSFPNEAEPSSSIDLDFTDTTQPLFSYKEFR